VWWIGALLETGTGNESVNCGRRANQEGASRSNRAHLQLLGNGAPPWHARKPAAGAANGAADKPASGRADEAGSKQDMAIRVNGDTHLRLAAAVGVKRRAG
jgi:hypothetical protein